MPSNSTQYSQEYYEKVIKPKRKKEQEERRKQLMLGTTDATITIQRECPICHKVWEETVVWKSSRKPTAKKQCKECILEKQKEYVKRPKVRKKINERLRRNYAENSELRERKKANTYRWRDKILANEETAIVYREKENKRAKAYNQKQKKAK